jgi:UDP-N-acetylmuramoyl-L-alanyl-D-glutamate--2,6-diaminopimelate ligase
LIAGKGHETAQVLGQERIPFDDREVARQWLYEFQPFAPAAVQ